MRKSALFLAALLTGNLAVAEYPQALFARNAAMGETGVAHARAQEAHVYNPAMLAGSEKATLTIPGFGIRANDPEDLTDEIEDLQDTVIPAYNAGNYQAAAAAAYNSLSAVQNEAFIANVSLHIGATGKYPSRRVALNPKLRVQFIKLIHEIFAAFPQALNLIVYRSGQQFNRRNTSGKPRNAAGVG